MTKIRIMAASLLAASLLSAQPSGKQPGWAAGAKVATTTVGQAPNSAAFGSRVYFAGQPSESDLADYAKLGVKTVVNLRTASEMERVGYDEAAAAKAAGLKYFHVPVGSTMPNDGELTKIYNELSRAGQDKVLVHCASSNRSGMIWAAFRAQEHGLSPEHALEEGKAAGMTSPALQKVTREKLGVQP